MRPTHAALESQVCHQRTSLPAIAPDGTVFVLTDTTNLIALKDTAEGEIPVHSVGGSKSFTSSEQPGSINPDGFPVSPTNPWKPCADFFVANQFNPPDPAQEAQCRSHR